MSNQSEIITRLGNLQGQIWQTISQTVSEAVGQAINFANPLTVQTDADELIAELSAPMVVIQFSFADQPEHSQVLLLNQESFANLVSVVKNEVVDEVDDMLVNDNRLILEAIVNGICLAVGNAKNHVCVANELNVKYQIFSFPPNLQRAEWLGRVQVAMSCDDLNGTVIWLTDPESSAYIASLVLEQDDEHTPFLQLQNGFDYPTNEESNGLNLLYDVPLEISVELGRVKMMVRDVLGLGTGAIIEIDKAAGEPVDVMVNGRLVARGEVVVIEDNFGVRITEIVQQERGRLGEAA